MRRKIYEIILNSIFREAQVMIRKSADFPKKAKSKIGFMNPVSEELKQSMPTSVNESS